MLSEPNVAIARARRGGGSNPSWADSRSSGNVALHYGREKWHACNRRNLSVYILPLSIAKANILMSTTVVVINPGVRGMGKTIAVSKGKSVFSP